MESSKLFNLYSQRYPRQSLLESSWKIQKNATYILEDFVWKSLWEIHGSFRELELIYRRFSRQSSDKLLGDSREIPTASPDILGRNLHVKTRESSGKSSQVLVDSLEISQKRSWDTPERRKQNSRRFPENN